MNQLSAMTFMEQLINEPVVTSVSITSLTSTNNITVPQIPTFVITNNVIKSTRPPLSPIPPIHPIEEPIESIFDRSPTISNQSPKQPKQEKIEKNEDEIDRASLSPRKRIPNNKNIYGASLDSDERSKRAQRREQQRLKRKQKREKDAAKKQARTKAQTRRRINKYVTMKEVVKMRKELQKVNHNEKVKCPMCPMNKERA
eukprot:480900_1